jgi:hypothetical protein
MRLTMNSDEVFGELLGTWVSHVSFGTAGGLLCFTRDEDLHSDPPSLDLRVYVQDIKSVLWEREGMERTEISRDLLVFGHLESADRTGDTWTLVGGFGRLEIRATDVFRADRTFDAAAMTPRGEPVTEPPHLCEDMAWALDDEDNGMLYVPEVREYGYASTVDSSFYVIDHCPFCGDRLPSGLRTEWFDRLDELGLDPIDDLPEPLQSDRWWREEGITDDEPSRDEGPRRRLFIR